MYNRSLCGALHRLIRFIGVVRSRVSLASSNELIYTALYPATMRRTLARTLRVGNVLCIGYQYEVVLRFRFDAHFPLNASSRGGILVQSSNWLPHVPSDSSSRLGGACARYAKNLNGPRPLLVSTISDNTVSLTYRIPWLFSASVEFVIASFVVNAHY